MSYLDLPLDIPLTELPDRFRESISDLLRDRGCPERRMNEALHVGQGHGIRLFAGIGEAKLTRRLYVDVVEASVSLAMDQMKLVC